MSFFFRNMEPLTCRICGTFPAQWGLQGRGGGEIKLGKRFHGSQKKQYKDTLKTSLHFNIPTESWEQIAQDRAWPHKKGCWWISSKTNQRCPAEIIYLVTQCILTHTLIYSAWQVLIQILISRIFHLSWASRGWWGDMGKKIWLTVFPSGNSLISPYTQTAASVANVRASYVWHFENRHIQTASFWKYTFIYR